MAGPAPVELTLDCDACRLENGVIEIYDALVPACRFGLAARTRCNLCGRAHEAVFDRAPTKAMREIPANRCPACLEELAPIAIDERCCGSCGARAELVEIQPATRFATLHDLEAALDAWAQRESFPTRHALASATFIEADIERLFELLRRGARIEVLADPFANMGVRTAEHAPDDDAPKASPIAVESRSKVAPPTLEAPAVPDVVPPPATSPHPLGPPAVDPLGPTQPMARPLIPPPEVPPPSAPPRAILWPLVSVVVADGEIHPEERALVDRFLVSEGLPPLTESEYCVHHPSEVAHLVPRERREDVVKLMCESAAVDGMPDESERRVIRAYATAWGVDDEKLEFWMWGYEQMNTSLTRALWLKLRRFILSARWSDASSD